MALAERRRLRSLGDEVSTGNRCADCGAPSPGALFCPACRKEYVRLLDGAAARGALPQLTIPGLPARAQAPEQASMFDPPAAD